MACIHGTRWLQEETQQLQAALAEREDALHKAQAKAHALESECSALRAAVDEAEAGCRDLQSRLAEAEVCNTAHMCPLCKWLVHGVAGKLWSLPPQEGSSLLHHEWSLAAQKAS